MSKTEKDTEIKTSREAKKAGLQRIERRHLTEKSEVRLADCKVKITINLDADILEYFKQRAAPPHAAPYQTQINNELRRLMESDQADRELSQTARELLRDDKFVAALKDRLKAA
ncbi:MAG: BrnA antitoxin family protein [Acidobacteria bacterium]|nr:BrnA antitoxin family protein [Acidobacteriota bacterium]